MYLVYHRNWFGRVQNIQCLNFCKLCWLLFVSFGLSSWIVQLKFDISNERMRKKCTVSCVIPMSIDSIKLFDPDRIEVPKFRAPFFPYTSRTTKCRCNKIVESFVIRNWYIDCACAWLCLDIVNRSRHRTETKEQECKVWPNDNHTVHFPLPLKYWAQSVKIGFLWLSIVNFQNGLLPLRWWRYVIFTNVEKT